MLDLQSYLLYELYMARRREVADQDGHEARPFVARALAALGNGLVASGSVLKRRYEPAARRRVQTSS